MGVNFDATRLLQGLVQEVVGQVAQPTAQPAATESATTVQSTPNLGTADAQSGQDDTITDLLESLFEPISQDLIKWAEERLRGDDPKRDAVPNTGRSIPETSVAPGAQSPSSKSDFATRIGSILEPNQNGEVNEEELFAAIAWDLLGELSGPQAQEQFRGLLSEALSKPGASVEAVAIDALKKLVDAGVIDSELGDRVYAESFAAAQLDDVSDALYDGRGGPDDPTIATADFSSAVAKAEERLEAFRSGSETPEARELADARPTGGAAAGQGGGSGPLALGAGFVFKPISESDGNLVILLPQAFTGRVTEIVLRDANGEELASSESSGVANGGREHFRFDRPGGRYPKDLLVQVKLKNGETVERTIGNPRKRVG